MNSYSTTSSNRTKNTSSFFFANISPPIILRDSFRGKIHEILIWIVLEDKERTPMLHDIKDKEGQPAGKQRIVILVFDLYNKEISKVSEKNELRSSHTKFAHHLKT